MLRPHLVLTWTREQMCLAHSEIASNAGTNDVSHIGIIDGSNICLIFAGPWHVEVFVSSATDLDAHVEFGVGLCCLELSN